MSPCSLLFSRALLSQPPHSSTWLTWPGLGHSFWNLGTALVPVVFSAGIPPAPGAHSELTQHLPGTKLWATSAAPDPSCGCQRLPGASWGSGVPSEPRQPQPGLCREGRVLQGCASTFLLLPGEQDFNPQPGTGAPPHLSDSCSPTAASSLPPSLLPSPEQESPLGH